MFSRFYIFRILLECVPKTCIAYSFYSVVIYYCFYYYTEIILYDVLRVILCYSVLSVFSVMCREVLKGLPLFADVNLLAFTFTLLCYRDLSLSPMSVSTHFLYYTLHSHPQLTRSLAECISLFSSPRQYLARA